MKNRHGQKLAINVDKAANPRGLAFVVHGLGGFKELVNIREVVEAFQAEGFTAVSYDAANTLGESDGKMEDATLTNYYEDLEDVVNWAKTQPWFMSPFVISGHSLGGACSIMFAAAHPHEVLAIAPICPFIAGELYEARHDPALIKKWQADGFIMQPSQGKPGVMKKLNWSLAEDLRTQDVRKVAPKVTCPSLFIAGSEDHGIPPEVAHQAADKVRGRMEFHTITGMGHNPRSPEHLKELGESIRAWAKKLV